MTDFNPKTDLQLDRRIAAPPQTVWRCFTDPTLFAQWFAPPSVDVRDVDYEFHPGGKAHLTMVLPDGTEMPLRGCVIEAIPAQRLVTTDAITAGYRPAEKPFMTAIYSLEPTQDGTHLHAHVLHPTETDRKTHEDMGFHEGWGITFAQLADLAEGL